MRGRVGGRGGEKKHVFFPSLTTDVSNIDLKNLVFLSWTARLVVYDQFAGSVVVLDVEADRPHGWGRGRQLSILVMASKQ